MEAKVYRGWVRLGIVVMLAWGLTGCDDAVSPGSSSELDQQLESLLIEASGGAGLSFFMLPEPDAFDQIPQDPRNPLNAKKVELGKLLFHETGLLVSPKRPEGKFTGSCASCHHAQAGFQAGRIQGISEGGMGMGVRGEARTKNPAYADDELDVQPIRSPTALNVAYQDVMLWNGQFGGTGTNLGTESQWNNDGSHPTFSNWLGYEGVETQAIAALKVHRLAPIESTLVVTNPTYQQLLAEAFPEGMPETDEEHGLRVAAGLAIAAYERTLLANKAPWQEWLRGKRNALSDQEKRGAILFFGKAACVDCHTGPALNSMTFYALGMPDLSGPGVFGPVEGTGAELGRGGFTKRDADMYKFKTPQLYNLIDSPFMGHGGTFRSVREVVAYKNAGQPANPKVPASQLAPQFKPLGLTEQEIDDLTAFIEKALYDRELTRYVPSSLPSGNCFPFNDPQSRQELGCN